jgi:hypothetical protein
VDAVFCLCIWLQDWGEEKFGTLKAFIANVQYLAAGQLVLQLFLAVAVVCCLHFCVVVKTDFAEFHFYFFGLLNKVAVV